VAEFNKKIIIFFNKFPFFYNSAESDDGSGCFGFHDRHFELKSEPEDTISEQSSCERLSSSPVMISPPGTGTPVYIASQPESIDLDSNHSSLGMYIILKISVFQKSGKF